MLADEAALLEPELAWCPNSPSGGSAGSSACGNLNAAAPCAALTSRNRDNLQDGACSASDSGLGTLTAQGEVQTNRTWCCGLLSASGDECASSLQLDLGEEGEGGNLIAGVVLAGIRATGKDCRATELKTMEHEKAGDP